MLPPILNMNGLIAGGADEPVVVGSSEVHGCVSTDDDDFVFDNNEVADHRLAGADVRRTSAAYCGRGRANSACK